MIYVITLNPSLDYYLKSENEIIVEEVNRFDDYFFKAGGKGINVSKTLDIIEEKNRQIVVVGHDFVGNKIKELLKDKDVIYVDSDIDNRINVKVHSKNNNMSFNPSGPIYTLKIEEAILNSLKDLKENDYLLLCGSYLKNTPFSFIKKLSEICKDKKAHFVIDNEKIKLEELKELKPYLIKPNLYEYSLLMNKPLNDIEGVLESLDLILNDVDRIIVSLGKKGAIYADKNERFVLLQDSKDGINSVGMGDAMLATFIGYLNKGIDNVEALKLAASAGKQVAMSFIEISKEKIIEGYKNSDFKIIKY